jgi:hypothetical protein
LAREERDQAISTVEVETVLPTLEHLAYAKMLFAPFLISVKGTQAPPETTCPEGQSIAHAAEEAPETALDCSEDSEVLNAETL